VRALFTSSPVAPDFKSLSHAVNRFPAGRSDMAEVKAGLRYWGYYKSLSQYQYRTKVG